MRKLAGFPRFHRRGLIEGWGLPSMLRSALPMVFRGFTAAASLKGFDEQFFSFLDLSVFRGFTAAASLKDRPRGAIPPHDRARVFRGFTAAASLKVFSIHIPDAFDRMGFPRFHRRGLIEGS